VTAILGGLISVVSLELVATYENSTTLF